jgi:ABC-type uncharacterized transport system permease subunit
LPEVPAAQLVLLAVAILCFAGHEIASIAAGRGATPAKRVLSRGAFWSGVSASIALLIWHSVASHRWLPLGDNFTALIWLGLLLALFLAYIYSRRPLGAMEWVLTPIVILLLIGAGVFGRVHPHEYVTSTWSAIHLISSFGGAVAFAVAGGSGFMYLLANRRLRSKHVAPGPHLGSLERLEHLTLISVTLGFALLTVGMITGVVKVLATSGETSLGHPWWLSPKVLLAFTVWVIYGIVLHSPINPSFRGRKAAMLSVVGFVLMIGTLVAVMFVPGGKH